MTNPTPSPPALPAEPLPTPATCKPHFLTLTYDSFFTGSPSFTLLSAMADVEPTIGNSNRGEGVVSRGGKPAPTFELPYRSEQFPSVEKNIIWRLSFVVSSTALKRSASTALSYDLLDRAQRYASLLNPFCFTPSPPLAAATTETASRGTIQPSYVSRFVISLRE